MKKLISLIFLCLSLIPITAWTKNSECNLEIQETSFRSILLQKLAGEWLTQCIYAATELDIPQYLQTGPKSIIEIAIFTKTKEDLLYRLMNTLASSGIFTEFDNKIFSNNPISELLSPDHSHSLYDLTLFYKEAISPNWRYLSDTLKTGVTSFEINHHMPVFQYFKQNPTVAARFNLAMKSKLNAVIDSILKVYNFSEVSSFYDIGAGNGHFTYSVLKEYSNLIATIFELPEVIESSKSSVPNDIASRCFFISGDFFKAIPADGDCYFLKSIIHDWSDSDSLKILKNIHESMPDHARLLIVELVLLPSNIPDYGKFLDILMMTITGGRERSLDEIRQLLEYSDFTITNVFQTHTEYSIIEARKNPL